MKLWSRSIFLLSLMREVELMSLLIEILLFVCYGDLKSWKIYGKCVLDAVFSPDSSEYYILENWYLVLLATHAFILNLIKSLRETFSCY